MQFTLGWDKRASIDANSTSVASGTGAVHTWGFNNHGEIGNDTTVTPQYIPYQVTLGSIAGRTIVAIAGGYFHTIALDTTGAIHTWGGNFEGVIGNNTTAYTQLIPYQIALGSLSSISTTSPTGGATFFTNFTGQHRVFVKDEDQSTKSNEGLIVVCDNNDYITAGAANENPYGKFIRGHHG